ncbi:MAG: PQQ-binding-like beta-propeller repeat protein, partial [Collinsella sp.]
PYGLGGVELYSVTSTVDGTVLANLSTSYWQAYVNGVRIDDSLDEAKLNSGDKLVWRYLVDSKRPAELVDGVVVEPDADRPVDSKSDATGFGNAVTNADTPTGATAEAWTFNYKQYVGGSYANASEPVIVDGYIYLAVNDQLLKIDCQTGKVASSAKLKASVSYTARPVYAKGLVMVPLSGGSVQALTVDKLKTVWMTSAVSAEAQSSSSLTVDGDYLYIGTADGTRDITKFVNGFVVCIDIQSGKEVWRHNNANEGYYWTGGVAVDGKFVVPTSSGTVEVLDQKTGEVLGELSLGVTTNSSIVVSQDGKTMYLVTRDGKLHVISFDDSLRSEASLSEKTVDLGLTGCASIPTLLDNNTLLVGGEKGDSSALAIVDLKTMSVKFVSGSDGAALPAGGIKAAPLVSKQAEGTYVYFTVNSAQSDSKGNRISGGGVYRYKMGDAEATLAYDASGH